DDGPYRVVPRGRGHLPSSSHRPQQLTPEIDMTRKNLRMPLVLGSAMTLALAAACTGSGGGDSGEGAEGEGGDITLSYAFFAPAASFPAVQMEEWAAQMNERTDGQVT